MVPCKCCNTCLSFSCWCICVISYFWNFGCACSNYKNSTSREQAISMLHLYNTTNLERRPNERLQVSVISCCLGWVVLPFQRASGSPCFPNLTHLSRLAPILPTFLQFQHCLLQFCSSYMCSRLFN